MMLSSFHERFSFFGGTIAISSLISGLFHPYFRLISGLFFQNIQNFIFLGENCNFIPYFKLISTLFQAYFGLIFPKHPKFYFLGGKLQFHPLFQAYSSLISGLFRAYFSKPSKIVFFGWKVAISSLISSLFQAYFGLIFPKHPKLYFLGERLQFHPLFQSFRSMPLIVVRNGKTIKNPLLQ